MFFKKQIIQDHTTRKEFSYSKGKVSLKFVLNLDNKSEIKDFKDLLETALEEIEREIL